MASPLLKKVLLGGRGGAAIQLMHCFHHVLARSLVLSLKCVQSLTDAYNPKIQDSNVNQTLILVFSISWRKYAEQK